MCVLIKIQLVLAYTSDNLWDKLVNCELTTNH